MVNLGLTTAALAAFLLAEPASSQEVDNVGLPVPPPAAAPTPAPEPVQVVTPAPAVPEALLPPPPIAPAVLPSTAPIGVDTPPQPPMRHPHSRGLVIGGAAALGAGYLISVLAGAVVLAWAGGETCSDCPEIRMLFVPIAGPFVFAGQGDSHDLDAAIPLCIIGGVQVIGFGLLVGGIIQAAVAHKRADQQTFGVAMSRDGVPQLALRF